ncbi:SRPBCC domain-containing protein [Nocardia otitidiscaviarum]|uniref:SRPBCC domain-containing protein n=1 Tax=Nocardia otitidiscaviarum TaxID=1823 RepID=UPI0018948881|nr:SRPBCC domain-containing protein [Nocardia otitidiscaviarum]MBF6239195.1 SRPBCC domain-containing protein [Nocardia otitidiscaviarum]
MPLPDRIERRLDLRHPPERVWTALTTSEGLGGWFGSRAEVDELAPGATVRVWWDDDGPHSLRVQTVEPPRRFAFTWAIEGLPATDSRRTHVEFTLEPTPTGTRLTVVETGFAQLPDDMTSAYEGNVTGWTMELADLTEYLDAAA